MELSSPKHKKFLMFQEELPKPQRPKFIIFLQKKAIEKNIESFLLC